MPIKHTDREPTVFDRIILKYLEMVSAILSESLMRWQ